MKILFDTNVILDVLLKREPFFKSSSQVLGLAELGKIEGWVCATTVTTIHYLLTKTLTQKEAVKHTQALLKIFDVATVNRSVLGNAFGRNFGDYEDAVLYQSAKNANLEAIITRNGKDFTESSLPVYSPTEFLKGKNSLE